MLRRVSVHPADHLELLPSPPPVPGNPKIGRRGQASDEALERELLLGHAVTESSGFIHRGRAGRGGPTGPAKDTGSSRVRKFAGQTVPGQHTHIITGNW